MIHRERLTPLAQATLSGSSGRTVDKARERVVPDVWDERLRRAVVDGVARLRALWVETCFGIALVESLGES